MAFVRSRKALATLSETSSIPPTTSLGTEPRIASRNYSYSGAKVEGGARMITAALSLTTYLCSVSITNELTSQLISDPLPIEYLSYLM